MPDESCLFFFFFCFCFFCQAEDGIRYLVRSRGLGDVYKRQEDWYTTLSKGFPYIGDGKHLDAIAMDYFLERGIKAVSYTHLTLPTSDLV